MTTPSCNGCGLCCRSFPAPPFLYDGPDQDGMIDEYGEASELGVPQRLIDEIAAYLDGPLFDDKSPCLWLDRVRGTCLHHEHRPGVCRDYPMSGPDCRAQRKTAGLTIEGWPLVDDEVLPGCAE